MMNHVHYDQHHDAHDESSLRMIMMHYDESPEGIIMNHCFEALLCVIIMMSHHESSWGVITRHHDDAS